jgi:RNA polymerase sigma-70 factor (ECF subfamily)
MPPLPGDDERRLVEALRAGEEEAFVALIRRHGPAMTRVAALWVKSPAVAEEVVQETWLSVLGALDRFEGRSSLRTWIFAILVNTARRRAEREGRSIPFASLRNAGPDEPEVDADRFLDEAHPRFPNAWAAPVDSWASLPEERLLGQEALGVIAAAIAGLPPAQREVMTLRDVEGWPADEVCALLGLSDGNQRVLLHRARSSVRRAFEAYVNAAGSG